MQKENAYQEPRKLVLHVGKEAEDGTADMEEIIEAIISMGKVFRALEPWKRFETLMESLDTENPAIDTLMYEVLLDAYRFSKGNLYAWLRKANDQISVSQRYSEDQILAAHKKIAAMLARHKGYASELTGKSVEDYIDMTICQEGLEIRMN